MLYIECRPDQSLVKSLVNISKRDIVHEFKGKAEICKQLAKQTNDKGLVDEDPASLQPEYIRRLRVHQDLPENGLRLLHDDSKNNYLIVLCPKLEDWILDAARQSHVDVRKYGLPTDARKLHGEINLILDKFEKLLEDLKDSARLKALKRLLEMKP